jgi:hypothetical protein
MHDKKRKITASQKDNQVEIHKSRTQKILKLTIDQRQLARIKIGPAVGWENERGTRYRTDGVLWVSRVETFQP